MASIEFFWDPVSPYTYLASTQLPSLAREAGVALVYRPFFLGGVMQATGNRPPATVASKGRYMMADLQMWARAYKVPLTPPETFPAKTILALRAGLVTEQQGDGERYAQAIMRAYWGQGRDISDPAVVSAVLSELGLDAPAILALTEQDAIKAALKANTEEAVARGAFGAPSLFVGEQLFWGNDRLDLLRRYLDEQAA
ncbi:2-hydroxychromene-2-carboxylate isomerase [Abyssibacter profundi]|uniref:2-hydroxychromene-2-carboxylate isomerase n=1 Tax=Abyssibacter profundi TaxID=2182787 RepID=UPI001A9C6AEF|nr:2-hydroxychromene-2-carboxylate isomerase [Abyssibacter profundi]